MEKTIFIKDINAMKRLAFQLEPCLFEGFVLCLEGDLGAGKTTFTQFLGQAMGIKDHINSPTFTIMKIYDHDLRLYHIDAYRLQGQGYDQDLEDVIGIEGVSVIEWYQYIQESLPKDVLKMHIVWVSNQERQVTIEGTGPYENIVKTLGR